MTVYDEYMKNNTGSLSMAPEEPTTNGTENVNPAGEEGKDAE